MEIAVIYIQIRTHTSTGKTIIIENIFLKSEHTLYIIEQSNTYVVSTIRLGGDVQVIGCEIGEAGQERLDEVVVVSSGLRIVGVVVHIGIVRIRKSDATGSFNEDLDKIKLRIP